MGFKDSQFVKPSRDSLSEPTKHLYLAGLGDQMKTNIETLIRFLVENFGELDTIEDNYGVYMPEGKRYCFVSFKSTESSKKAKEFFEKEKEIIPELGVSRIVVKFAHLASTLKSGPTEPECTSSTDHIEIPGLHVIKDFISEEEENELMNELGCESAPWRESLSRRVQHYGFIFNYRTLMVDYTKPTPPFPESCNSLSKKIMTTYSQIEDYKQDVEKLIEQNGSLPELNQLTINEYQPGQGIASHTDTETCFGPALYILNIGCDIVMNLTKNTQTNEKKEDSKVEDEDLLPFGAIRKYVHLPQRCLLILGGESRYHWSHGISPRKFDKINGELIPRKRRISFTFRHAVRPGPIPSMQLQSGKIEEEHVVKVYDAIAIHWNHTRGKRKVYWHRVKDFIDNLPSGTLLADIGSGDGKYFGVNPNIVTIGCDRSTKLLEVSKEIDHETFACDAVKLPFVSNMFDAVICIAVLHHLASVDRRYAAISECIRIAKVGGFVFIQAWALEQGSDSKRNFESQDTMVPWKLNKRFLPENNSSKEEIANKKALPEDQDEILIYERYCHVYKEGELEDLCSRVPGCRLVESGWDRGNWFVRLEKVRDDRLSASEELRGPESKIPVLVPKCLK